MINHMILSLDEIQPEQSAITGNKAASLAFMKQAGFAVPDGVCLTTGAFSLALEDYTVTIQSILQQTDLTLPANAEKASQDVMDLLDRVTVPEPLIDQLIEHRPSLYDEVVAVRSSASAEDEPDFSYAGQYETLLGIRGKAELSRAIVACWKSFFAPQALSMRATRHKLSVEQGMAVIIQPLIQAECAGVCYSVDPIQARPDVMVVNAAWGLGIGIADGRVASDTYWVEKQNFAVNQRELEIKPDRVIVNDRDQLEVVGNSDNLTRIACLPDEWLQEIAQMGLALELAFKHPQDIEWAIADQQVWILQSRPLTGLPSDFAQTYAFSTDAMNAVQRKSLWRLEGNDTDPILPLEQDHLLIREAMRDETCRFLGANRNQEVRFINGRMYTRPLAPTFTAGDMRIRRQAYRDLQDRLHEQGLTSWDYWGPEIITATKHLASFDPRDADGSALALHLEDAIAVRRRHYMLHPMCWFHPHPAFFKLIEAITGLSGIDAETTGYQLLEGAETPLTQVVDQIYEMAEILKDNLPLQAILKKVDGNLIIQLEAAPEATVFLTYLKDFLAEYGDHTGDGYGSEATMATATWREEPAQVVQLVQAYVRNGTGSPSLARAKVRDASNARFEALCQDCDNPELESQFRRERDHARKCVAVLEIHNHYIDQTATGQLREAVMYAAGWMVQQNILNHVDEILWLNFEEIIVALRSEFVDSYTSIIIQRQTQHRAWQELAPPPILGVPTGKLPIRPEQEIEVKNGKITRDDVLQGLGASPGYFEGQAYVLNDPNMSLPDLSPDVVLIADNIGPRWTPLFPLLGGLVLNGGALGQHSAAIAREYGLPAVIQTKVASRLFQSGDAISVDGTSGEVRLLKDR